ncbi:hypothetical protein NDU88_003185, partial [Pleurodeles waltl]
GGPPSPERNSPKRNLKHSNVTRVGTTSAPSATSSIEERQNGPPNPKGWEKITKKDLKTSDWAKDSSDKFYSLTEESDVSSGEHSFSETGSSETSETGNKSSNNQPTVRQLRRHRKCTKVRPDSQEGFKFSASTGSRTLKWDYSGIRLTDMPTTIWKEVQEALQAVCVQLAPTPGCCSRYTTRLKNFKQRPGLKVAEQGSLQSDCKEQSARLRNHARKLKPN